MPDDVEKFLAEKEQLDSRRKELINETLKQKEAAIKSFDEKLAKLGYKPEATKRSHHKKTTAKPSAKPAETKASEVKPSAKAAPAAS